MKNKLIILAILSFVIISCNTTFLNHKDYECKLADFSWYKKIEGQVGEIYIKGSNLMYGWNGDSTFIEISSKTGAFLDTLHPYTIEKERECLILDSTKEYKNGYKLFTIPVDKQKYAKVTFKDVDSQYRGDDETYYLIVQTLAGNEFTILFNRKQFTSIEDIFYFKEGKYIVTYNTEAGDNEDKYLNHVGLFDLDKIIKKE